MPVTVIKSATIQVTQDASIVFDDTGGVAQIRRGSALMAADTGQSWEQAARQVAQMNLAGLSTNATKLAIIDGGLMVVPRILQPQNFGLQPPLILFSDAELRTFALARYATLSWISFASTEGAILGTQIALLQPFDFIYLNDLSQPVTPAQLQPYVRGIGGRGIFHPGGFLAGTHV